MSLRGKVFFLSMLFCIYSYAGVKAYVDENPVISSEMVEYEIEAVGESVRFPTIKKIGSLKVSAGEKERLEWFEGNKSVVKWVRTYTFSPQKSMTIPAYKVIVDGKEEWTKPIFLQVKANSSDRKDDFRIELKISKREVYEGEPVDVAIRFLERRDVSVMSVDFVPIKYENFWVKRVGKPKRYGEGNYLVHEVRYLFFPQKSGELKIGPAQVKVARAEKVRDAFGFIVRRPKWSTMTSEVKTLEVKPLPEGVELVGDYRMSLKVSPKKVQAGQPVTLTIRVEGDGNIEDFELRPLRIDGVTVYADEPKVEQHYSSGIYSGSWEKRFVLIAESSYTIPPFKVRFLDPDSGKVKEISSDSVKIEVVGALKNGGMDDFPSRIQEDGSMRLKHLFGYVVAFFAGVVAVYLFRFLKRRISYKRGSRSVPDEHMMLQRLMPYISESKDAAQMAENLYANLFEGKAVKIDKKRFEKLMADLKD